jgi:regulatory protein
MAPEQDDAQRGRLRVARFGEVEPDQADGSAPVARFGGPPDAELSDAEPGGAAGTVSHALLDRLGVPAPAPVAPLQSRPLQERPGAPVVGLSGIDGPTTQAAPAAKVADVTAPVRGRHVRARPVADGDAGTMGRVAGRRSQAGDSGADAGGPDTRRATGRGSSRFGGRTELAPDADPVAAAREICLRLLSDRARTRQELAQALQRKGVPDDAAGSVLERFDEVGLIDDAAFAGQWVRSRHNNKGLARRAIAMELRRKGVDDEVAGEALAEVDTESEETRARELVDRKLRTMPAGTPEQRKKAAPRLVGMLARKGYSGGIAYRVVKEALAAHGAEIDELGTDPLD